MLEQQKSTQHYKIIIFQFKEKIHCRRKPAYQGYNCHCQEQGFVPAGSFKTLVEWWD